MLSTIFSRLRLVNPSHYYALRLLSTAAARETGVVKRFSKEKGYGFITKKSDGTDHFVHFKSINSAGFKTLEAGQEVEFSVVQGEKGSEAKDVNVTNTQSNFDGGDSERDTSSFPSAGFGQRRSNNRSSSSLFNFGGNESSDEQKPLFNRRPPRSSTDSFFGSHSTGAEASGKPETGSVKRWNAERGFGFIRRTNGGADLFCHARSLKDGLEALQEGQTIQFHVQPTEKGEEARDVSLVSEEIVSSEAPKPEKRVTGTVKRWIPEKGYGFIELEPPGSDVFVHLRGLTDGVTGLEEGQKVEFDLVRGGKGEMAQNVTVSSSTSST